MFKHASSLTLFETCSIYLYALPKQTYSEINRHAAYIVCDRDFTFEQ